MLVHADREIAAAAEVMAGISRRKKERLGVWEPVMTDSTGPRTSLKEGLEFGINEALGGMRRNYCLARNLNQASILFIAYEEITFIHRLNDQVQKGCIGNTTSRRRQRKTVQGLPFCISPSVNISAAAAAAKVRIVLNRVHRSR